MKGVTYPEPCIRVRSLSNSIFNQKKRKETASTLKNDFLTKLDIDDALSCWFLSRIQEVKSNDTLRKLFESLVDFHKKSYIHFVYSTRYSPNPKGFGLGAQLWVHHLAYTEHTSDCVRP